MVSGAREVAYWLRALVALVRDLDLTPRTHKAAFKPSVTPIPGHPLLVSITTKHAHDTDIHASKILRQTHKINLKNFKDMFSNYISIFSSILIKMFP